METQKQKHELVELAQMHQDADRFVQGNWLQEKSGDYFKGCSFGCMTQSDENTLEKAAQQAGLPIWLISVAEKIFEGLPIKDAKLFVVKFYSSITPGKDHAESYSRFFYKLLMDKKHGQITFTKKGDDQYNAVIQCADLFKDARAAESAWSAAESAAWSAARSAAESAAESAARSAARSAAWSAARSAESCHYIWMAKLLILCVK